VIQNSGRAKSRYDYFFGEDGYEFITGGFENYDFNHIFDTKSQQAPKSKATRKKQTGKGTKSESEA
jgi:hypothetical protein